jgi:uncharacterized SAM-binding protein YcdF (DUF218 family)
MFSIYKVLGHLAMPLPALLLLALGAVVGLDGSRGRILAGVPLAVLWLLSTPALSRWLLRPLEQRGRTGDPTEVELAALEPADVVVVLSGGFPWRDLFAIRLFQMGKAPLLLFSGRLSARTEAILRNLIELTGVPRDRVLIEAASRNTAEGGSAFRALATTHGWRSVLLVSNGYHLSRALHHYRGPAVEVRGVGQPGSGAARPPRGRARPGPSTSA